MCTTVSCGFSRGSCRGERSAPEAWKRFRFPVPSVTLAEAIRNSDTWGRKQPLIKGQLTKGAPDRAMSVIRVFPRGRLWGGTPQSWTLTIQFILCWCGRQPEAFIFQYSNYVFPCILLQITVYSTMIWHSWTHEVFLSRKLLMVFEWP